MMKNKIIITTILLFPSIVLAQQVHESEAVNTALSVLNADRTKAMPMAIKSVAVKAGTGGDTLMYEITTESNYSVFVSGNKKCQPILGMCENYGSPVLHNYYAIPEGLRYLLDTYCAQNEIAFGATSDSFEDNDEWEEITKGGRPVVDTVVGKLLTTQWAQSYSNDNLDAIAYNYYMQQGVCPTGEHCWAGQVAVAMGQILAYWHYPAFPGNNGSFEWCDVSDALYTTSPNYANERDAISYLLYQCGLSVNTIYCRNNSCDESFADSNYVANAFYDSFEYSFDVEFVHRMGSDSVWLSRIKYNLDNGWPVFYGGVNAGESYSFVCDGYLSDDRFSFNWGCGGLYNNNWFTLNSVMSSGNLPHVNQYAVVGIHPRSSSIDYCNYSFPLYLYYHIYYEVNQNTSPAPYYNVPTNIAHLISVPEQYNASWRTIPFGANATYGAHSSVTLVPGFYAAPGSEFNVRITPCPICENTERGTAAYAEKGNSLNRGAYNTACKQSSKDHDDKFKIYPNPTDGLVTVEFYLSEDGYVETTIYDMTGTVKRVLSKGERLKGFNTEKHDVSHLPNGIYVVKVTIDGVPYTNKMIKQ